MLRRPVIVALVLFAVGAALPLRAQRENSVWCFGTGAGIVFVRDGQALAKPVAEARVKVSQSEGSSSIADPCTGRLLFAADGPNIYDSLGSRMPNSFDLLGGFSSTQAALIVPDPGNVNQYYVFTAPDLAAGTQPQNPGNSVNVVDMRQNGGRGDIVRKNIVLPGTGSERLCATHDASGRGFWVVTMEPDVAIFHAYHLTTGGLDMTPVISSFPVGTDKIGYMKISPDGRRLAVASRDHLAELYSFDPATGVVSDRRVLVTDVNANILAEPVYYGVSFSPDNSKVYFSARGTTLSIIQFDLAQPTIDDVRRSGMRIAAGMSFDAEQDWSFPMQLGPDGLIYVGSDQWLHVIKDPNAAGMACTFSPQYVRLEPGMRGREGLPNLIDSYDDRGLLRKQCPGPEARMTLMNGCTDQPLYFTDRSQGYPTTWTWSFPGGVPSSYVGARPPAIRYSNPGAWPVILTVGNDVGEGSAVDTVYVDAAPGVYAGQDVAACQGTSVRLRGRSTASKVHWEPASRVSDPDILEPTVVVTGAVGMYILTATSEQGCSASDTVFVRSAAAVAVLPGDTTICPGGEVLLRARGGGTYEWMRSDGLILATTAEYRAQPMETTRYYVVVRNAGCTDTATVTVVVAPLPVVGIVDDTTICRGESVRLVASGGVSYRWTPPTGLDNPASPTPVATPFATTRYTVRVTSAAGCAAEAAIRVTVTPEEPVRVNADTVICAGGRAFLSATGATSVTWEPSTGLDDATSLTPVASPTVTTTYHCYSHDDTCRTGDSVRVTVAPMPSVVVTRPGTECTGEPVTLTATGADVYTWYDGAWSVVGTGPTRTVVPAAGSRWSVVGTSTYGCADTASVDLDAIGLHTITLAGGTVRSTPGSAIVWPVWVTGGSDPLADSIDIRLRVSRRAVRITGVRGATILTQQDDGDDAVTVLRVSPTTDTVAVIDGFAYLSRLTTIPIAIEPVRAAACTTVVATAGSVELDGCDIGRRSILLASEIRVQAVPTGDGLLVQTEVDGHAGGARIDVVDVVGRLVDSWEVVDGTGIRLIRSAGALVYLRICRYGNVTVHAIAR